MEETHVALKAARGNVCRAPWMCVAGGLIQLSHIILEELLTTLSGDLGFLVEEERSWTLLKAKSRGAHCWMAASEVAAFWSPAVRGGLFPLEQSSVFLL